MPNIHRPIHAKERKILFSSLERIEDFLSIRLAVYDWLLRPTPSKLSARSLLAKRNVSTLQVLLNGLARVSNAEGHCLLTSGDGTVGHCDKRFGGCKLFHTPYKYNYTHPSALLPREPVMHYSTWVFASRPFQLANEGDAADPICSVFPVTIHRSSSRGDYIDSTFLFFQLSTSDPSPQHIPTIGHLWTEPVSGNPPGKVDPARISVNNHLSRQLTLGRRRASDEASSS
ncbi:hypothetical protein CC1G_14002 [Coprinopsis cinerea okayama7|uniref:Uncharacterized protein n=1 Tax=Coprinopsis cinerea (strain Okayama-7 / 130 / ATCC MYA-4618 / FGSC 9003) TaxID=240176 RepID=D6RKS6_COPC7|nr:hypothetical protein CC1G_14002 [Coprinopsis cinerea okayama7\|eukprot:XP_002911963.1 hypothetical protein CC1G_14002 [Coprinopsis cinerea okayama7\